MADYVEVAYELAAVIGQSVWIALLSLFRWLWPETPKSVRGKVVLVTGAGGGLGRRLAKRFAELGATLVVVDINQNLNNETLQSLQAVGHPHRAYVCDVSNEKEVEELAESVRRDVGDVDILVNNAGVLPGKPLAQLSSNQIKKTFDVNVLAHFWTIRQFLPRMLERGEGHIVAIASVAGILGSAYLVDYCASKYAVMGLMSSLREELHEMGKEEDVHLTVICPSTIDTGLVQRPKTRFPSLLPILDPDHVADTIVSSVLRNKRLVVIPHAAHIIYKVATLFPPQVPLLIQRFLGYTLDPNVNK